MGNQKDKIKRPVGVWLIVCFFGLSYCLAIPAMIYTINNHPNIFEQFSGFELVASTLTWISTLIAVVLLFRLRALSFWIFLGVTLFSITLMGIKLISGQQILLPDNVGVGEKIFEIFFWGTILIYTWKIKSKGMLK